MGKKMAPIDKRAKEDKIGSNNIEKSRIEKKQRKMDNDGENRGKEVKEVERKKYKRMNKEKKKWL